MSIKLKNNKIGTFEGMDILLKEKKENSSIVECEFDDKFLEMEISNSGNIKIINTNMYKAQIYYISNSIRDLYLVLYNSKAGEV